MVRRISAAVLVLMLVAVLWPASVWSAYVTPTSRSTGFVVTAARWNQDVVDNMIAVRTAVLDTVVNGTASTDMTLSPTGDELVLAANKSFRITGGSASPANVGGIGYDTDEKAFVGKTDLGVQRFTPIHSSQTTDSSAIANTVAETSFDQLPTSFPANTLVAGRVIRWTAVYLYSNTGTPTMRLKFKLAGTATKVIGDTGTQTQANLTNEIMVARGTLTILTAGASGTYRSSVEVSAITGSSITFINGGPTSRFGSPDSTIDTTQVNTLTDTWIWGAASASNTIKRVMFIVEG